MPAKTAPPKTLHTYTTDLAQAQQDAANWKEAAETYKGLLRTAEDTIGVMKERIEELEQ